MADDSPTDAELRALLAGDLSEEAEKRLTGLLSDSPNLQARLEDLAGVSVFASSCEPEATSNPDHTESRNFPEVEALIADIKRETTHAAPPSQVTAPQSPPGTPPTWDLMKSRSSSRREGWA